VKLGLKCQTRVQIEGPLQIQRVSSQSQSGWKQVQVLRVRTWVRIWALLPNTVEYPQHLISIPFGVLTQTLRTPGIVVEAMQLGIAFENV